MKIDDKFYPITSLCKDDIKHTFGIDEEDKLTIKQKKLLKKIDKLSDTDMMWIARKMADAYCNDGFWIDLKIITEGLWENENEK